ncbi:MAG: hypothetical protein KGL68_12075 [Burkholderiales bacterium]|nr:hypothetical protein [Burkholderiales bacterium]
MTQPDRIHLITRRSVLLTMAGSLAALSGCGGGGGAVAGLSSGGTGSFTSGTVTGLGSIIVNGIRYDDSAASVLTRDDGTAFGQPLNVGMVVSVQGSAVTPATSATAPATATAYRISVGSEWLGPVQAIDTVANRLTLLGATVDVLATTVFAGSAVRLADVVAGRDYVEIYGYVDLATGHLQASRVEVGAKAPAAYRISGKVSGLDTAARTFALGPVAIQYTSSTTLPGSAWGNDSFVRVTLATPAAGSAWAATAVQLVSAPFPALDTRDDDGAELHGTITSFTSPSRFSVNGIVVDASQAQVTGTPALGADVEVQGHVSAGVIVASSVKTQSEAALQAQPFEFIGPVSALDTTARTFSLKGQAFRYTGSTSISATPWTTGATPTVQVEASLVDGEWIATEIQNAD